MRRRRIRKKFKGFFGARILAFVGASFLTMLLWNNLVPDLFGGPIITLLQAMGLLILSKILFSGGRGRCHGGRCGRRGYGHWRHKFKEKMEEKMAGMTPEEREKFKEGFKGGAWEVNIIEVEDDEKEEQDDDTPPKSDPDQES